jgi:hypothetical protein
MPAYHTAQGNVLRIENLRQEDGGNYLCTAQSNDGRLSFDGAFLQISKPQDPNSAFPIYMRVTETPDDIYTQDPTYRFGVKITVECVAQTSDPGQLSWNKVAGEGAAHNRYKLDQRESSLTISFPAFLPMDIGTYVCMAERDDGSRAQNSITFKRHGPQGNLFTYEIEGPSQPVVETHENDNGHSHNNNNNNQNTDNEENSNNNNNDQNGNQNAGSNTAPTAKIISDNQHIILKEGDSLELNCQIDGSPQAEWQRNGGQLPASSRVSQNGQLSKLR